MFGMSSGAQPSVMKHDFSMVPRAEIPRSAFDRSHGLKTTFNSGFLVPIYADEALPGDTFNLRMSSFARMSTPIKPLMDNLYLDLFFFAVPKRLLWANFQKFMGAQANPGDSTSYLVPTMTTPVGGAVVNDLSDYLTIPTVGQVGGGNTVTFNSWWHRAYNFIWNEWFRDQNLQNSVTVDTGDGPDTYANYQLLQRGKRHDYFTSCLPWPQKGNAVTLPLGSTAPVITNSNTPKISATGGGWTDKLLQGTTGSNSVNTTTAIPGTDTLKWGSETGMQVDLSNATAATINAIRQAFQIQKLYERDARGGTRYTEVVRSHFGVTSPDFRLQRPEYLGGGSTQITFTAIPQTGATGATGTTTAQGNLAAVATHSSNGIGFVKSFTEHMVLLGLASVRADLNYQQGLNRMFSRSTRWDFYWPALSHIGEQTVLNKEIYCDGSVNDSAVFGYQERYAEYRYKNSVITGLFRSTASGTLDIWHAAQKFTSVPVLNSTFIKETPPLSRILAVSADAQIYLDAFFKLTCARPMPTYGVPGNIDRF
jgi:hypothetical protein